MKKIFSLLLTVALVFSLSSCSQEEQTQTTEVTADGDVLVAYFSWAENAVLPDGEGEVDAVTSPSVLVPGNVQLGSGGNGRRQFLHQGYGTLPKRLG